jgi:bifunctional aspartokinase / homoserine dehydrogenase 1
VALSAAGLATEAFSDFVVGHGELWCARLFAASMRLKGHHARMLDARDVLVVDPTSDGQSVDVDYDASNKNLDNWAAEHGDADIIVGTGFIARDTKKQVCCGNLFSCL